ncbi:MAG: hypothetical protein JWO22_2489, partial [Frankiales bacterium]|nr:hypothetical protein [Frankiales bacterium]
MVDREYVTGYLKNLSFMLAGFVLAIGWILLVVSLPLSHDAAGVLASLCVIPLFGGIIISNVRIFHAARERPSAIAYRRLPLWLRLMPPLLLVTGV